jgi:Bacterial Ig domain
MRPRPLVVTAMLLLGACGGSSPVSFGELEDGATIGGPQHTHLDVATDQDVVRVELYLDGARVGEAPFAPFDIAWSTAPFAEGEHALRGIAYLIDGSRVDGTVHLTFDNTPPQIYVLDQVYGDTIRLHVSDNTAVGSVELHVADEVRQATFDGDAFVAPWDRPCGPT